MARTTSKAKPTGKAQNGKTDRDNTVKAPRKTRGQQALELIVKAETPAQISAAVMAVITLPAGDAVLADPDMAGWLTEHAATVFTAEQAQAGVISAAEQAKTAAETALVDAKSGLKTAQHGQAERTRDAQRLVFGMLDVHHVFRTADELAAQYGLPKSTVSRYRAAGAGLAVLGSDSPQTAQGVATALTHDRKATTAAIRSGDRDKLREVIAGATGKRTAVEAKRATDGTDQESRPPAEQATELASTLASVVGTMNGNGDTFADLASSTGVDAFRRVTVALAAYAGKHGMPWPEVNATPTENARRKAS